MKLIQQKDGVWKGKPANPEECQGYNCFDCLYWPFFWNDTETVCLAFFLQLSTRKLVVIL